jgi:FkbM family methyltransferase
MGFQRLMKSIVRDLMPYAGLDTYTPSGVHLQVPDRGAWSTVGEVFITRGYDHFYPQLESVRNWVDIGCNQGFVSIGLREHLIRVSGSTPETRSTPATRVFLGDANETCVARVRAAIEHNHLKGWRCERTVIGPPDSFVRFEQHKDSVHSNIFAWGRSHKNFRLATTNITQTLADEKDLFDLIKIDIEGAERFLFHHHVDFLKRFRYGLCEWHAPMFPGSEVEEHLRKWMWRVVDFRSSADQYDLRKGHSWESRFGMVLWENPSPTG